MYDIRNSLIGPGRTKRIHVRSLRIKLTVHDTWLLGFCTCPACYVCQVILSSFSCRTDNWNINNKHLIMKKKKWAVAEASHKKTMWFIHQTFSKCETSPYHKNSGLRHLVVQLAQASSLFCSILRSHLLSRSCLCFPLLSGPGPGPGLTCDWLPTELYFWEISNESDYQWCGLFGLSISHGTGSPWAMNMTFSQ